MSSMTLHQYSLEAGLPTSAVTYMGMQEWHSPPPVCCLEVVNISYWLELGLHEL